MRTAISKAQKALVTRGTKAFGARLRAEMKRAGVTPLELAGAINVTRSAVHNWSGGRHAPSMSDLFLLAHELGCEPAALTGVPLSVLRGETPDAPAPSANGAGGLDNIVDRVYQGVMTEVERRVLQRLGE